VPAMRPSCGWWTSSEAVALARHTLRGCGFDEPSAVDDLTDQAEQLGHEIEAWQAVVLILVAAEQLDTLELAHILAAATQPESAGLRAA
jgi:hypothetical protein